MALTGQTDTYGKLLKRCIRTALKMKDLQIAEDDVVCICSEDDHLNGCVPLIASLFIGAKTAYIEPGFSVMDTAHLLNVVSPKIIFVVSQGVRLIEKATDAASLFALTVVFGDTDKHMEFRQFLEKHPDENAFRPITVTDEMATATIAFSSGTTGLPKGICINQYRYFKQASADL